MEKFKISKEKMVNKILILVSFILFTYSFFACVREVLASPCSIAGEVQPQCFLTYGWNTGVAQSDDEWYGFNCGENVYNQLKIRSTAGGDYSLCKIEDQAPGEYPTTNDICYSLGETLDIYQDYENTYWVLVHRNGGNPGFEIYLDCASGPYFVTTTTISQTTTANSFGTPSFNLGYSQIFWGGIILVVILAVIFFFFILRKRQHPKPDLKRIIL